MKSTHTYFQVSPFSLLLLLLPYPERMSLIWNVFTPSSTFISRLYSRPPRPFYGIRREDFVTLSTRSVVNVPKALRSSRSTTSPSCHLSTTPSGPFYNEDVDHHLVSATTSRPGRPSSSPTYVSSLRTTGDRH